MREDLLQELETEYSLLRADNERTEELRKERIRTEQPEIFSLVRERENLVFGTLRDILNGSAQAENLPERMEVLSSQIREKLEEKGFPADYLAPVYRCPRCKDTGRTGELIKEPCECLKKAYQQKLRKRIGLSSDSNETFESFDLNVFPDEMIPGQDFTQRFAVFSRAETIPQIIHGTAGPLTLGIPATVIDTQNICETWANEYPHGTYRDLLLTGSTGLGKTFLLRAMAERLIARDVNVLIISAYSMLEILRKSYFENDDSASELLAADVLMIDDLGSEPLMQNVTVEQLFYLLNERQNKGLSTVISTNLDMARFRERYTERIASRLRDSRNCKVISLLGKDIRTGGNLKA